MRFRKFRESLRYEKQCDEVVVYRLLSADTRNKLKEAYRHLKILKDSRCKNIRSNRLRNYHAKEKSEA